MLCPATILGGAPTIRLTVKDDRHPERSARTLLQFLPQAGPAAQSKDPSSAYNEDGNAVSVAQTLMSVLRRAQNDERRLNPNRFASVRSKV
jgi:hypothetical protein